MYLSSRSVAVIAGAAVAVGLPVAALAAKPPTTHPQAPKPAIGWGPTAAYAHQWLDKDKLGIKKIKSTAPKKHFATAMDQGLVLLPASGDVHKMKLSSAVVESGKGAPVVGMVEAFVDLKR